jgi:transcriptional regulator with XRE-family HTH domain
VSSDDFGVRLRSLRRQLGITQSDLAGDDFSTSYVSLLESGKRRPTPEVALRLAARLDVAPEVLLSGSERRARPFPSGRADELMRALRRADLALLTGDATTAFDDFEEVWLAAADSAPLRVAALLGKARASEALGRLDETAGLYEQWLTLEPDPQEDCDGWFAAVRAACRCWSLLERFQDAVDLARRAVHTADEIDLQQTPLGLAARAYLADTYLDRGDLPTATDLLADAAMELERFDVPAQRAAAYDLASRSAENRGARPWATFLVERAISAFRDDIDRVPLAVGRAVLARLLAQHHDPLPHVDADALLRQAVDELGAARAGAELLHCQLAFARAAAQRGDADRAGGAAAAVVQRAGAHRVMAAQAQLVLAQAQATAGDDKRAQAGYETAARSLTDLGFIRSGAQAYLELATLYERRGVVDGALRSYRRATELLGLSGAPAGAIQPARPAPLSTEDTDNRPHHPGLGLSSDSVPRRQRDDRATTRTRPPGRGR